MLSSIVYIRVENISIRPEGTPHFYGPYRSEEAAKKNLESKGWVDCHGWWQAIITCTKKCVFRADIIAIEMDPRKYLPQHEE